MNMELIKKFADVSFALRELGALSVAFEGIHVDRPVLKELENLQLKNRDSDDFPYEIFAIVEGVRVFGLATQENISEFPQFEEFVKAEQQKKLGYLEEDVDLSGGELVGTSIDNAS